MKNYRDPQWDCRKISCVVITGVRDLSHMPLCTGKRSFKEITQGERKKCNKDNILFL